MSKKGIIVFFLVLGICGFFIAQSSPKEKWEVGKSRISTSYFDSLLKRTSKLYHESRFDEQIIEANNGIRLSQNQDSFFLAAFQNQRANAHYGLGSYTEAINDYNLAISSTTSNELGLNQRATLLFDRANAEYQLELMADTYRSTLASEEILSKLKHPDFDYLISVYVDLAYQSRKLGFYDDARKFLKKARRIYEKNKEEVESYGLEMRQPVSFAYNEILINADDEDEQKMLDALQSLESLLKEEKGTIPELIRLTSAYMTVADFYINLLPSSDPTRLKNAKYYLALTKKTVTKSYKPQRAQIKFNEAKLNYNIGLYSKAMGQLNELITEVNSKDVRMPFFFAMQGLTYMKLREFSNAQSSFRKMMTIVHCSKEPLLEDASNYVPGTNISHATLFSQISDTIRNFDQELFDRIGNQMQLAGMREFKANYQGKTFNSKLKSTYESLFHGMLTPVLENSYPLDKSEGLASIINQSETVENRLLWSKFLLNRRVGQLKIPDSVRRSEQTLRLKIVKARRNADSQTCFELENELEKLERSIISNYPEYGEFSQGHFDVEKLQKDLSDETLILKFVELNGNYFRFEIDKEKIKCSKLKDSDALREQISNYLLIIQARREDRVLANSLEQALLPRNYKQYSKLVVVNNLILGGMPFEALCDNQQNYLVENVLITYAPHLVFIKSNEQIDRGNGQVVVFYPSYSKDQTNLEGAELESQLISGRFKSSYFAHNDATRKAFIDASSNASILHLSMHAEINEVVGEQSCFLFNDDKFYLDELYGLNLSGQMAVLSACNTGRSFKDVRNGNASLQRAFMYAGIPSTLSSLWEIPDRSTQEIMESFYQSLKEGRTNGEAIREAKIEFLKTADDPHLRSPYFWAGFVLSGQDQVISLEPISNEFSYWYWLFGGIGIALIITSMWYRFRRGTKHQLH